ncbi:MAG TPA: APC family permease [Edaphobacter sp.]|nr:APC family permease [Edaphobacter sp.]
MPSTPPTPEASLHRQLRLRDLVLTQVLCVVGSSWVGIAAGLGRAQALTWIAAMILFYLPMAVSVIYLNREMPLEGGLYVWARTAFGDLGGFMTAWNLWFYGVAITATILYPIPTELSYLIGPSAAWLPENHLASFAIVAVVVLAITAAAVRGLELGKWIHNIGGISILIVYCALIVLPFWAMARHQQIHYEPLPLQLPRLNMISLALFGQMLFGALCGLEYIAILAGESKDAARSIGQSVVLASPIICAMFIAGTSSVLAFARGPIDFIAPIPQTLRYALGNNGLANLFAMTAILLVQFRLIAAASFIFTGVTRLPMAAGWDHLIPVWFTHLHPRFRTPINSVAFTCALVLLLLILANIGVHAQEAFQVLSNAGITHYEIAYIAMFAVPLIGSKALRTRLPGWLRWTSIAGLCATLFSFIISAYPFVDVVNPRAYAVKILGTTLLSNIIGYTFYRIRNRRPASNASHSVLSNTSNDMR